MTHPDARPLSAEENRVLAEIADHLIHDDPGIAHRLRSRGAQGHLSPGGIAVGALLLIPVVVLAAVLAPGLPAVVPIGLVLAAAIDHAATEHRRQAPQG